MGRALIRALLPCAAASVAVLSFATVATVPVSGAPFAQDARVDALKREYGAIRSLLEVAETHEQGRLALQAFVERLSADPDADPSLVYHRAKDLAADRGLTPDAAQRARWFDVAARAAARTGRPDTALWMQEERARVLIDLGALDEARAGLEAALERHADASTRRPLTLVALAEALRRLGRFDEALGRVAEAEALGGGELSTRVSLSLARSAIRRDVGAPELAQAELRALADELRALLAREDGQDAASYLSSVRIELLRVASARADHATVRREAQELLDDPALCRSDAERAQVLMHLGAARLELEPRTGPDRPSSSGAREAFEQALRLDPDPADAFFVRTRLVAQALEDGDMPGCLEQLEALRAIPAASVPLTTRIEGAVLEARVALAREAPRAELATCRDGLARTWDDLARAWSSTPRDARGVAFLKYSHRRAVLSWSISLELALEPGEAGVESAFAAVLAAQELSTLAGAGAGRPTALADLRRDLLRGADHGLLVYLSARDRSHVFAIDREAITHHVLADSSTLEGARREYLAWLLLDVEGRSAAERTELVREERKRAARLAELVLPDVLRARCAGWERWSISGMDTLGLVPFAWLPFGAEPFLGTRRALDEVPSLPHAARAAALARAEASGPLDTDLVLVTDALPGGGGPELERVELGRTERAALASIYARDRLRVLEGDRASVARLSDVDLGRVAVLQLVVHGVEQRDAAVPVALVLSPDAPGDDGLLRAEDIERLDGAPCLVVLTACGSGRGPTRRGDPALGSPTGAWLAHGARAVVATQQELSLREARRTTRILHRALHAGATPAEALRDVRADLAHAEPELAPFLHGLQQVVGLGHEPLFAAALERPTARVGGRVVAAALVAGVLALVLALVHRAATRGTA